MLGKGDAMDVDPPKKRRRFFADAVSSPNSDHARLPIPRSPSQSSHIDEEDSFSYDGSNYAPSEGGEDDEDYRNETEPTITTQVTPNTVKIEASNGAISSELEDQTSAVETPEVPSPSNPTDGPPLKLDPELLAAVLGEQLPSDTLKKLDDVSGGNMERAVNMYLDGSWSKQPSAQPVSTSIGSFFASRETKKRKAEPTIANGTPSSTRSHLDNVPSQRYIGCLGIEGWATRSGTGLLSYGEKVGIERQKIQPLQKPVRKGKGKASPATPSAAASKSRDIIVRITNSKGEIGRLPREKAEYISTLLDEKICTFTAVCVYCPDTIRTGDVIYLQMQCYLVRTAFDANLVRSVEDSNRATGPFEAKETVEEKALRLRQLALVKLFDEIGLHPTKSSSNQQEKRDGLLRGAELAEAREKEQSKASNLSTQKEGDDNSGENEEDGKVLEQDQLDSLYQKAQKFDFDSPEAEPASTFTLTLRRYQRQALYWMISKEKNEKSELKQGSMNPLWEEYTWPSKDENDKDLPEAPGQHFWVNPYSGELSLSFPAQENESKGGILADEMGLGKTIEMMSLIHSNRADLDDAEAPKSELQQLAKSPKAVLSAPRATLVVAPMSLLSQWAAEAEKSSTQGSVRVITYYGSDKNIDLQAQCCAKTTPNLIIITSYGTVLSEFGQYVSGSRISSGGLFSVEFFRIILDEAHHIKNRTCKTAKACYQLNAVHRWVLTGTPIVNRLEDLYSLVRFLRIEPWCNFSFWRTFITVPFESQNFLKALDVVQTVLEPVVMRRTKDMKQPDGTPLVALPPKTILVESIELSEQERAVYDFVFNYVRTSFNENMANGTVLKSYASIFTQILRLRQACCHPTLVRKKEIVADEVEAQAAADKDNGGLTENNDLQELIDKFMSEENGAEINNYGAHALKQIQEEAENECPICSAEPIVDQAVTNCFHMACKPCLQRHIKYQKDQHKTPRCFNCREPISDIFEVVRHENELGELNFKNKTPEISLRRVGKASSAKIETLLNHLKRIRREEPGVKSVVFSQFTSFIDLVEASLKRERFLCLRFDGSMSQAARAQVLSKFKSHPGGLILIISLRAGGVGLNLTDAEKVFVLDPYWSFSIENQAIDRIHRIGQTREVTVYRFIVKNSIEERMVYKIQERKKFIASSLGMMNEEQKRAQRIEDIKDLLSAD